MNRRVFEYQLAADILKKTELCIALKTAMLLRQNNPKLFEQRIRELCVSRLYENEDPDHLQCTLDERQMIVEVDNYVLLRYIDPVYPRPQFLNRQPDMPLPHTEAPLCKTNWLDESECPILELNPDIWQKIGVHLDIDSKRYMAAVSRRMRREFDRDVHWIRYQKQLLKRVKRDSLPYGEILSVKQRVLRCLMYVTNEKHILSALFNPQMGKLFAGYLMLGYYRSVTGKGVKRQRTELLKVSVKHGYENAHLVIGSPALGLENTYNALIWVDENWQPRICGDNDNKFSCKFARELLVYRQRIML